MTSVVMTSAVEVCRVLMRFFLVVVVVEDEMGAEDVWELAGVLEVDSTGEVWIVLVFKVEGALEVYDTAEVWTVLETEEVLELAGTVEVDETAEVCAEL